MNRLDFIGGLFTWGRQQRLTGLNYYNIAVQIQKVTRNQLCYVDKSYIGTPLNKSAVNSMKLGHLTSNVPYSVKKRANLSEAVQIGLRVCDEQQDKFENIRFSTLKT